MLKFWYLCKNHAQSTQSVTRAARELGVRVEIKNLDEEQEEVRSETADRLLIEAQNEGVDALVCRGSTELILKASRLNVSVPIIPVQFLGSSTFSLLGDVRQKHPEEFDHPVTKAAIFSHRPVILDIKTIRFLLNLELDNVVLQRTDAAYVREQIRRVKAAGIHFIMAGPRTCELAKEEGINAYFSPDVDEYESIYRTFEQAIILVENMAAQKERSRALETIMDYSFEATLQLDTDGRVMFCNSVAEEILKAGKGELLGKSIWEKIPELDQRTMEMVLRGGENIYGSVLQVNECIAAVNVTPYVKQGTVSGAIVHLSQKEQLEKLEGQIKQEIYSKGLVAKYHFSDILGESDEMEECKYRARQFAKHHANILIFGESGTGKELFAQSIHNHSTRKNQPFVAVNCGALPVNLLESELFGYVGGAFTGAARQGKKGLLELADKGTIFLDEISEMDLQGQVRLLRVLEERVINKVGDDRVIPVDVRIIAASNKNLRSLVTEGKFREDLYYRLNVLTLNIPPLRKRQGDVRLLADYFLRRYGKENSKEVSLTPGAYELIARYPWSGNVRQLRNFCERLVIISNRKKIDREMVYRQLAEVYQEEPEALRGIAPGEKAMHAGEGVQADEGTTSGGAQADERRASGRARVDERPTSGGAQAADECGRIVQALNACSGNRGKAAQMLGIARSSLWRKMKQYGIGETF